MAHNAPLSEDDYIAVGLACCFSMNANKKLDEAWIVEPLTTGTIETMELGVETSYKRVMALRLGDFFEGDVAAPTGVKLEALNPLIDGYDARVS